MPYWIVLFSATHYPRLSFSGLPENSDKWMHASAFGLLALLFWLHAWARYGILSVRFVWIAMVVLLGYAAIDERTQGLVDRHVDFYDWVADAVGIVIVLAVLEWFRRRRKRAIG